MDKAQLEQILRVLPDDASELSIPRHDSNELVFNSDLLDREKAKLLGALPAQKGTYRGPKRRWKIATTYLESGLGTPIKLDDIPSV